MMSVIHRKVLRRCRQRAYDMDLSTGKAKVKYRDFIKVCRQQRLADSEARDLLKELQQLELAEKLSKTNISLNREESFL